MKHEKLNNYIQLYNWMNETIESSKLQSINEMKMTMTPSVVDELEWYINDSKKELQLYFKLSDNMADNIISLLEETNAPVFKKEHLQILPIMIINLETEVINIINITSIEELINKMYKAEIDLEVELGNIIHDLNNILYNKNKIYNFFNQTKKKINILNSQYQELLNLKMDIEKHRPYFFENNKKCIYETVKDVFESNFGCKFVITKGN